MGAIHIFSKVHSSRSFEKVDGLCGGGMKVDSSWDYWVFRTTI